MKRITYLALIFAAITLGSFLQGATLVSQVDARRTGGTSVGSFVGSVLPSFLLAPSSGNFSIRNSASPAVGQWEFALDASGRAALQSNPTILLDQITTFSSSTTVIATNGIPYSADRFNPSDVWFLFARVGTNHYAFEVAIWSSGAGAAGDRLRFYGAREAVLQQSGAALSVVPEPGAMMLAGIGSISVLLRRRRSC